MDEAVELAIENGLSITLNCDAGLSERCHWIMSRRYALNQSFEAASGPDRYTDPETDYGLILPKARLLFSTHPTMGSLY